MKISFGSAVCVFVLLGTASLSFAGAYGETAEQEESPAPVAVAAPEPEQVGYWYIGAAAVYSIENFDRDADNAWGYHGRAGRRINDMFALEIMGEHLASDFDDYKGAKPKPGKARGDDIEAWNLGVNGKVYPITGRFQPFALVGIGYGQADVKHGNRGDFIARFGLGLDVLITDNVGIAAEVDYILPSDDIKDFDQIPISLGVFYNFI